ncbi:MAG: tetratricopeptide repeat protein [Candidatus Acidiferrales bacterium]
MRRIAISKAPRMFGAPRKIFLGAAILVIVAGAAIAVPSAETSPAPQGQSSQGEANGGITVAASPQLFATMCALDAAGFDADESTLAEMPARLALRDELLKSQGPAAGALRQYYRDHALADPGETLSRYITFALVAGPPPDFEYTVDHDLLPPDVLAIEDFQTILANFYREANLDVRWQKVEPEYNRAIDFYQPIVRRIVMVSNGYLREIIKPSSRRTFAVYVEPLVGNRTNFRNSGDNYAIVVGAGSDPPVSDIQHAYLHFLLDPLPLKYRDPLNAKRALLNIAARAPRLPVQYQDDFISFVDECLIKAVELRLRHLTPEQLDAAMAQDDADGFTMVHPIVMQLMKFEKAEPAMSYYFPDLIAGIDVAAEQKRLQNIKFAQPSASPAPQLDAAAHGGHVSDLDRALAEGDRQIALKNGPAAEAVFQQILAKHPSEPRAVYGLAIASILSRKIDQATALFQQLLAAPGSGASAGVIDPSILAWSHVYLGRIHDVEEDRDLALGEYRAALTVSGAPEAARVAAQRGIDAANLPPDSGNKDEQK